MNARTNHVPEVNDGHIAQDNIRIKLLDFSTVLGIESA